MKTTTTKGLLDDELNPKILIITGMHRSTSSLITQWLQRCGLFIGERFIGSDPANIQGQVEDFDFLKMHEHLLEKRHYSTTGLTDRPIPQLTDGEVEDLKALVEGGIRNISNGAGKMPGPVCFLMFTNEYYPSLFIL